MLAMKQQLERAMTHPNRIDTYLKRCGGRLWDEERYPKDFETTIAGSGNIVEKWHCAGPPGSGYQSACRHHNWIIGYLREELARQPSHIQPRHRS